MPRPAQYSTDAILQAAAELAAVQGPTGATIGAIAEHLGAPTGSIYHRFPSKDLLLAELWLQTVDSFQGGFEAALMGPDARAAGLEAALYTPGWVRSHLIPAQLLLLHHRDDFLPGGWPPEVTKRAEVLAKRGATALRSFAQRALGTRNKSALVRARYAVVDLPYAAVRRHLRENEAPPPIVDELVRQAYLAVIPRTGSGARGPRAGRG